ncbi:MAG: transcription elongation factor GreB [Bdellovibrionaceae bacterium]|nr:transcription elongation factor GreB [Pseudobdellovibrionaceae bacterium]MDW8190207.1 transcription elongation factor GreB [Pseudobdellovibrionaceae bacterium]
MSQRRNYITPKGFQKLKEELEHLLFKERPKLVETIAWAASNGDRSENADYIYGKRRLREIDSRIRYLQQRLDEALVVDPFQVSTERVVFGVRVVLENESGNQVIYQIVGEDEIDVKRGFISWKSPLAQALLGKKEGDEVVVKTPNQEMEYLILKIERLEYSSSS